MSPPPHPRTANLALRFYALADEQGHQPALLANTGQRGTIHLNELAHFAQTLAAVLSRRERLPAGARLLVGDLPDGSALGVLLAAWTMAAIPVPSFVGDALPAQPVEAAIADLPLARRLGLSRRTQVRGPRLLWKGFWPGWRRVLEAAPAPERATVWQRPQAPALWLPTGALLSIGAFSAGGLVYQALVPFDPGEAIATDRPELAMMALLAGARASLPGRAVRRRRELIAWAQGSGVGTGILSAATVRQLLGERGDPPVLPWRRLVVTGGPLPPTQLARLARMVPQGRVTVLVGLSPLEPVTELGHEELDEAAVPAVDGARLIGRPLPEARIMVAEPARLAGGAPRPVAPGTTAGLFAFADHLGETPHASGPGWRRLPWAGRLDEQGRVWVMAERAAPPSPDGAELLPARGTVAGRAVRRLFNPR